MGQYGGAFSVYAGGFVAMLVCSILAIGGGIALYFTFLMPANKHKFHGFLDWLYQFLNFDKLILDKVLRAAYLITALYISLYSLYLLFTGQFLAFLLVILGGNLIARIIYELILLAIIICRNVSEMNHKMDGAQAARSDAKQPYVQAELPEQPAVAPIQPFAPVQPVPPATPAQPEPQPGPQQNSWYCPQCGTPNSGAFCVKCGMKHQ